MSKLPNAPLLEVIFELRWKITNKNDLEKYQYLHGDLYSILKDNYPIRESLSPVEIPVEILISKPIHRFRKEKDNYPLYQVGPGLLTLNTIDVNYYWEEYFVWIEQLINAFYEVYPIDEGEKFHLNLLFFDFFKIDTDKDNLFDFINKYINIEINQSFYKSESPPKVFKLNLSYPTQLGDLNVSLNSGKNSKQEHGLVMQTTINGFESEVNLENMKIWLSQAHDFCSDLFKEMTKGELYESFKKIQV